MVSLVAEVGQLSQLPKLCPGSTFGVLIRDAPSVSFLKRMHETCKRLLNVYTQYGGQ